MAFNSNTNNYNFGFAFNKPRFSDRVLLIEVIANSEIETYGNDEWGAQIPKRRREIGEGSSGIPRNEHNINYDLPDVEDGSACEKKDEDGVAMFEEASSGDEATKSRDAISSTKTVLRLKTIHINSAILAAKSPSFYKLFSSEMEDSEERTSKLQIHANGEGSSGIPRNEHNINYDLPDVEDGSACEKKDEDGVAMFEEASSGDEATKSRDAISSTKTVLRLKTIHINSAILAAKSPSFYKLFSSEMEDSEERTSKLQIHANGAAGHECVCYHIAQLRAMQEAALMDLLHFIYFDTLLTTTQSGLVDVLLLADKFEVASCMRYCREHLSNLPMTCESALRYLDLTSTFLTADAVQTLTDAAKQFLVAQFKNLDSSRDQVLELPLSGFEAVLSSDELRAGSEDVIYDFVLKYAARHYQRMEDRKEILDTRLRHLIRFPYMSTRKLREVLTCRDFSSEVIYEVVMEALFFKADSKYRHRMLASTRSHAAGQTRVKTEQFVERAYKHRPVKLIKMEQPYHHSVACMDLKREECMSLFPAGKVYSRVFHVGSHRFFLSANCNMDQENTTQCFGLFICLHKRESAAVEANFEFAARMKPEEKFETMFKGSYVFTGGQAVGDRNLFLIPWSEFIGEQSVYFINGILHLRAVVAIKQ